MNAPTIPATAPQASTIRRYLAWRNRHARDQRLGYIVKRANVA
jgi:hypothetical protein